MKKLLEKLKEKARWMKQQAYVLFLAYKDPRTPWTAKIFAAVVVAYAFSPIDLVPDFIPVLGYLDDLILVPLGVALAMKMIPEEVLVDARSEVETAFPDGKPKNWVAGAIIVAIWVVIVALVVFWMVRWIGDLRAGAG
ncbi:MAG: DUF1232 domain-containing protein [Anaerolineaceae bacterium]|nr:DUF1232 domain-containing protein [Anaerolineaceae bacterium]